MTMLDLETLVVRPKISIDDKMYELPSHDELSIFEHHRLGAQGRKLEALMKKEDLSDEDGQELNLAMQQISDIVLKFLPEDIRAKLSDHQRFQVWEIFSLLPLRKRMQAMAALRDSIAAQATTGAKSSPASNGTTEATPSSG